MARRVHLPRLQVGETMLDPVQAHHVRDVLRLTEGAKVEAFDDHGAVAAAVLVFYGPRDVAVRLDRVESNEAAGATVRLTVACAVPKGDRADWMVEKLSELGVAEFIPLAAARSVVLPGGRNKRERWVRIATEAAKQSCRPGVMRVAELTPLADALAAAPPRKAWYLATEPEARPVPISDALADVASGEAVTAFVGPEGGWTGEELQQFAAAGARAVRLTPTILRVETAAIAVAAILGSLKA